MADIDEDDQETAKPKGGKGKLFLILAILIFVGGSTAGTLYFLGFFEKPATEEVASAEKKPSKKIPIYHKLQDPFTVNFETETGIRYLQISIEVMAFDQTAIDAMVLHMPVIRNNLILMFSSQTFSTLVSREGKELLRQSALEEIRSVIKKFEGDSAIEEVYFTSFVMQ